MMKARTYSPSFARAALLRAFALPSFLVLLIVIATALQQSFLSVSNFQDILTQAAPLLMVVLGQAIVILVRGLDLYAHSREQYSPILAEAAGDTRW